MTPEALELYRQRTGIRHWEDPSIYENLGMRSVETPRKASDLPDLREQVRLLTTRVAALEAALTPQVQQLLPFGTP